MNTAKRKLSFVLIILFAISILCFSMFSLTKASAMQVFFKVLNGDDTSTQTLEVEPNTSIDEIKARVQEKTSIPTDKIVIMFSGKVVKDGKTLSDYNIQKESTLHVIIRNEKTSCHGTENCLGIYVNGACTECEKDISIYLTPPVTENENQNENTESTTPESENNSSFINCNTSLNGNYIVFTSLTCFAIICLAVKSRKN